MSTGTTNPIVPQEPEAPSPRKRRTWLRWAAGVAAMIVAFVLGIAAGNAAQSGQTSSANHTVASLRGQLKTAQHRMYAAQQTAAQQRSLAAQAVFNANNAAEAKYQAKMAKANALLSKLRAEQRVASSSTISQDGVYVVGQDIPPGIYHTAGNGSGSNSLNQCYYATLSSDNTGDIIDNNNFGGPETVDLTSGVHAFNISGGCVWRKIG